MSNKTVLITGATDGLGKQVARKIAEQGATVLIHGRNPKKGNTTLHEIQDATGNENLKYYNSDFASLDEVRGLAERIKINFDRLDVLINNAGIGFGKPGDAREISSDGFELRFQVNYLAGFLLTYKLLPVLQKSAPTRIINVSSAGQQPIDFNNLMLENEYSGQRAYCQSKLAQIMFTIELADQLDNSEVTINALHPATFMDTNMVRESGVQPANDVEKGVQAVLYLAVSQDLEGVSGKYFNGKQEERANQQAYKKRDRQRLWELSEQLLKI